MMIGLLGLVVWHGIKTSFCLSRCDHVEELTSNIGHFGARGGWSYNLFFQVMYALSFYRRIIEDTKEKKKARKEWMESQLEHICEEWSHPSMLSDNHVG